MNVKIPLFGLFHYVLFHLTLPFSLSSRGRQGLAMDVKDLVHITFSELDSCGGDSVVLFYTNFPDLDALLKALADQYRKPFITHDKDAVNDSETKNIISKLYAQHSKAVFVLMVEHPDKIMDLAEEIYQENSRGTAAIMPHKSTWLIWVWHSAQEDKLFRQQRLSAMDNVAVVFLLPENSVPAVKYVHELYTFVWAEKRTKRKQYINATSNIDDNEECDIFPNKKHGMNGRHLQVSAQSFLSPAYFDIKTTESGDVYYTGYRYDYLNLLAQRLNFTYTLEVWNMSWNDYLQEMKHGVVDLGMSMWDTSHHYDQIDITYPILYDSVGALYKRPTEHLTFETMNTFILYPFPPLSFLFLPAFLLFTALLWLAVTSFNHEYSGIGTGPGDTSPQAVLSSTGNQVNANGNVVKQKMLQFLSISWGLFAANCNQGGLPNARVMSSRIIIWSWCLTMVVRYALYTDYLTSRIIKPPESPTYKSFYEMFETGQYTWGTMKDDTEVADFFNNSSDPFLRKLGRHLVTIEDRSEFQAVVPLIQKRLEEPFVLVYFNSFLATIVGTGDYVVLREDVKTVFRGFAVPKCSELKDLLSIAIANMPESGLNDHLLAKSNLSIRHAISKEPPQRKLCSNEHICIQDILALLFLVMCFIILSSLVLVIELSLALCPFIILRRTLQMIHNNV